MFFFSLRLAIHVCCYFEKADKPVSNTLLKHYTLRL